MPASHSPKTRIDALDQTKGILVVLMVIYHSLNYTSEYYLAFRYLSFLPPSFIFITGYLISSVYFTRATGNPSEVRQRLLLRGAKLLLLFTMLNVVAHLLLRRGRDGERLDIFSFFNHWQEIYFNGSGRSAVFEVLLPISYLLLLAPLLVFAGRRLRLVLPILTLALVALCEYLERNGITNANLNLLSAGTIGMLTGLIPAHYAAALGRHVALTILAYAVYVYLGTTVGQLYLVQMLGAAVVLFMCFALCTRLDFRGGARTQLVRLGQYSLLAYIAQIGFLQILSRFVHRPDPLSAGAAGLFTATLFLTVACVSLTDLLRTRSSWFDKSYKAIFA